MTVATDPERERRSPIKSAVEAGILADIPAWLHARQKLRAKIEEARKSFPNEPDASTLSGALGLDRARDYQEKALARRRTAEDKARNNLLGITLAFSVLFTGLTFLTNQSISGVLGRGWGTVASGLVVFGILYLLAGGWFALTVLQIGKVYDLAPEDEAGGDEPALVTHLLWCVRQNDRETLLRQNSLVVSFNCIRNGLLLFASLAILLVACLWRTGGAAHQGHESLPLTEWVPGKLTPTDTAAARIQQAPSTPQPTMRASPHDSTDEPSAVPHTVATKCSGSGSR